MIYIINQKYNDVIVFKPVDVQAQDQAEQVAVEVECALATLILQEISVTNVLQDIMALLVLVNTFFFFPFPLLVIVS